MGWRISELENTVKVTWKVVKDLFAAHEANVIDGNWFDIKEISHGDLLLFNTDNMEFMDWLWDENVQAILNKHKVKGRVCFGSLEGDNAGALWGYEFDGQGNVTKLTGIISWTKAETMSKGKKQ